MFAEGPTQDRLATSQVIAGNKNVGIDRNGTTTKNIHLYNLHYACLVKNTI